MKTTRLIRFAAAVFAAVALLAVAACKPPASEPDTNAPPAIAIESHDNGEMVGGLVTVAGTASDDKGVSKVEVSFDGGATYTTASGTASWQIDLNTLPLPDGNLFIKAKATDGGGYTAYAFVTLIIDNGGPSVAVISPQVDQRISGYFAVVGLGSKVDTVEVQIDSGAWQPATGNYTWYYVWDTMSVSQGAHTVSVRGVRDSSPGDVETLSVIVDQTVPNVSFTAPTIGEYIKGTKAVSGASSDPNGAGPAGVVDKVELSTNGGVTYTPASGTDPWSINLDTTAIPDGARILYARAKDTTGLFGTASVPVTIDNNDPVVAITSHSGGEIVNGVLHLAGTADDSVGLQKVDVSGLGGTQLADGTNSWNYDFNTATIGNGPRTVVVRATDFAGNYKETSVNITLDQHLPTVDTISVSNGAYLKGTVNVTGTASDGDSGGTSDITKVELKVGSGSYALCTGTESWSYSLDTVAFAPDGAKTITVRVTDSQGGIGTITRSVTFDNAQPTLVISNPVDGAKVATTVLIVGTATDATSAVSGVSLRIDSDPAVGVPSYGAPIAATFSAPNWHHSWDTTGLAVGSYAIEVTATDLAGNVRVQTVTVDKTTDVPSVSITSPATGSYLRGSVAMTGSASAVAATVVSVQIQVDSGALQMATGTDAWTFSLDTTALPEGPHVVKAIVTDSHAPTPLTALTLISITVDNTPPTVSIGYPTSANQDASAVHGTISVSGSAADTNLLKVQVSIDGAGFADAGGTTGWSQSWNTTTVSGSAKDDVVLIAKAIDRAGNETTTQVTVDVHPYISSLSKTASYVGDTVAIYGDNFTAGSTITFDGAAATTPAPVGTTEYSSVTVPTGATSGNVIVTTNGHPSNGVNLNIWKIDTMGSGAWPALVIDQSNNDVYVSHSFNAGGGNKYAALSRWLGGPNWTMTYASPSIGGGGASYTRVAKSGSNIYVAYFDNPAGKIMVAKSTDGGASFGPTPITAATVSASYLSLKVYNDGTDHVLVAYYASGTMDLCLVRSDDGGATFGDPQTVDSTGDVGKYASLDVDPSDSNRPVIAYFDTSNRSLKLAYWDGAAWVLRVVDSPMAGEYCSLAVAADGRVHLSYYDGSSGDQDYATAFLKSSAFALESADVPGITGWWGAMALDGGGKPHITYYDASWATLRYAEKTTGVWRTLTVPESTITQARTTIGIDNAGIMRIGYESGGSVKIARYLP